jgi:hypothetical protein
MTAKASDLDALPRPGPHQNGLERLDYGSGAFRHAEVRPIDTAVFPWRLVSAPGRFGAFIPVQPALGADDNATDLDHGTTLASELPRTVRYWLR